MLARTAIARYPTALSRSAPTGPHHSIHFGARTMADNPANNGAQDGGAPALNALAQYCKDFSFENPNAPRSAAAGAGTADQPAGQRERQAARHGRFRGRPDPRGQRQDRRQGRALRLRVTYSGVFRVQNIPQDQLHPVIMIECPRLLFPFARQMVADAVRNGGFPPLYIDPIDFVAPIASAHPSCRQQGGQTTLSWPRAGPPGPTDPHTNVFRAEQARLRPISIGRRSATPRIPRALCRGGRLRERYSRESGSHAWRSGGSGPHACPSGVASPI